MYAHLARVDVLRHKRHFSSALRPRTDLPYARLERIAGLDRRRKAHVKEPERTRVASSDIVDKPARGEAKRAEAVQDDAPEASGLAYAWVCIPISVVVSQLAKKHEWMKKSHARTYRCGGHCNPH